MSQSPLTSAATGGDYFRSWDALGAMIARGRSFSGHERDCCFLNLGGAGEGRFATASGAVGLDQPDDGRGVALGDWDGDGDVDVWTSRRSAPRLRFMRNDLPSDNAWLALRLEGRVCQRDAIGARVEVTVREGVKEARLVQTLRAGQSFVSQSSKEMLFGLGQGALVSVKVRWPGQAEAEDFTGVAARGCWRLVQGSGRAAAVVRPVSVPLAAGAPALPDTDPAAWVLLTKPLPLPKSGYADLDGKPRMLEPGKKPVLLVLWATWCSPCLAELKSLAAAGEALGGVEVFALNADGIGGGEGADAKKIRATLKGTGWPATWRAGIAPAGLVKALTTAHHQAIYLERDPALPSSFLLDTSGRLAAVYHGPVTPERVQRDAGLLGRSIEELKPSVFPFPGLSAAGVMRIDIPAMARTWQAGGYLEDALALLADFLKKGETNAESQAEAHYLTGEIQEEQQHYDAAAAAVRQALALTPGKPGMAASLARILWRGGKKGEAAAAMKTETAPATADAWSRAGQTWLEAGNAAGSLDAFDRAVQAGGTGPALQFGRAAALEKLPGRAAEAVALYRTLAQLPEAANNLAWLLATHPDPALRQPAEALRLATALARATARRHPGVLDTLAAATAAAGDCPGAARIAEEARALALATGGDAQARDIALRLKGYQSGKPFVDPAYP